MAMQLYGPAFSNNVFRPLVVARHLGLDLELAAVDMRGGEHRSDAYRKLNPHSRIPVLVDGDYALWESPAIMHYLADQHPNELLPQDKRARATILSWQAWCASHFKGAVLPRQFEIMVKPMFGIGETDPAVVAKADKTFETESQPLEERLAANDGWLVGHGLTLADIDVAGVLLHADQIGLRLDHLPATSAWLGKVRALPAWQQAATEI